MKTITMDFEEYEKVIGERSKTQEEFLRFRQDAEIVFGKEKIDSLRSAAESIRSTRDHMALQQMAFKGKY